MKNQKVVLITPSKALIPAEVELKIEEIEFDGTLKSLTKLFKKELSSGNEQLQIGEYSTAVAGHPDDDAPFEVDGEVHNSKVLIFGYKNIIENDGVKKLENLDIKTPSETIKDQLESMSEAH